MFSSISTKTVVVVVVISAALLAIIHLPRLAPTDEISITSTESQPDQANIVTPCTDAKKPSTSFSEIDIPRGWNIYVNEEAGFRFLYPADIRIEPETYVTNFSLDGSCVYAGAVHLISDHWEARLNATRGDYATGREGFNSVREASFNTKKGTSGTILIDPICGTEADPEWGPDCGHFAAFEENGISFLFGSFPKEYIQSDFESMPAFREILSTIETLPL